jgi:hypothetical protein
MSAPPEVLARPVFSAGAQDYTWADVVAAARAWGRWDDATRPSRGQRSEDEVEEAGQAFRYERNLLAAEEMEAWLAHWGLTVAEWRRWLRGEEDGWPAAVCSGALAQLAHDLAARAASAEAVGSGAGPVETELAGMGAAFDELTHSSLRDEDRARLLEAQRSDWVRVRYGTLSFPELDMAREAVLCINEDGLALSEVAERAGAEAEIRDALVADIDSALAKTLLGTPAGTVVGPLSLDGSFVLAHVEAKVPPSLADPAILELVDRELPRRVVEREVRNRVRWHDSV